MTKIRLSLIAIFLLGACSQNMQKQCVVGPDFKVMLSSKVPTALDGYDYTICPLTSKASCDRYNQIVSLRPIQLTISIIGKDVAVRQSGGSIENYKTDPSGMTDPNYLYAHNLYLSLTKAESGGSWIKAYVGTREVALANCE